jgi:hypothetical protein
MYHVNLDAMRIKCKLSSIVPEENLFSCSTFDCGNALFYRSLSAERLDKCIKSALVVLDYRSRIQRLHI